MPIIKKYSPLQNLSEYNVFLNDTLENSKYFRISEFAETFTGGKNGFLIEGTEHLKETTEIKIEIKDVEGNPVYYEPGSGIPEYYEGNSILVSAHVYNDTPIGIGKITVLGELKTYLDENGNTVDVPDDWKGIYNLKWEKEFKINKNLSNVDTVRFYKRPQVQITEIVKSVFNRTIPTATQTGSVEGFAVDPQSGQKLSEWRAGTNYLLKLTSGSWNPGLDTSPASQIDGILEQIRVDIDGNTEFRAGIREVVTDDQIIVDKPYTNSDGIVRNFPSRPFTASYQDYPNDFLETASLEGSYGVMDISRLKTFVGDVARVKIFRRSQNTVGDYEFIQEAKLESQNLLKDVTQRDSIEVFYGKLSTQVTSSYWQTSSADHPLKFDTGSVLRNSVYFDYDNVAGGVQKFFTSRSLSISEDVEYTLEFNTLLSGSLTDDKTLKAYLSSSDFVETFPLTVSGSQAPALNTRQRSSTNLISKSTGNAKLVFEAKGDDWYISDISLRTAQETSFSPDEFTIIQNVPRSIATETFDFKFEFYDINNNYIPVDVFVSKEFDGGNDFPTSGRVLQFESDKSAFKFTSGSYASPANQQLKLTATKQNLTGSILITSQAFDPGGNLITSQSWYDSGSAYYGGSWTGNTARYPGFLTNRTATNGILKIANFSGSLDTPTIPPENVVRVDNIVYTASCEGIQEFETILRLEEGDNAPDVVASADTNQFIFEPTSLSPKPASQTITILAKRRNLGSLVKTITVASGSDTGVTPPPLTYVDTVRGTDRYTVTATAFSQSFAYPNNFDSVTYEFTSSDEFGNQQDDALTISKVINYDGVSLVLSNESTSFPAKSTGVVTGGFAASSGSVQMFVGNVQITHDDYDSDSARNRNTFDIKTITESNVTASSTSPTNEFYSITGFDTNKDSGSLTLNIEYLAGDNSTSQSFQKIVSYTKAKKAVPTVLTKISPSTQTINSSSLGFQAPQNVEVIVQEGGTEYTHDNSLSGGGDSNAQKFKIVNIVSGSQVGTTEFVTPHYATSYATPSAYEGTIGNVTMSYVDSEGTYVENKVARFDVAVSKTGIDGDPAKAVNLKTDRFVILYDEYGSVSGSNTIGLTGSAQGYGTPEFQFLQNDTEIQAFSTTNTIEVPTDGGSLPSKDGTAFFEVRVREQGESYTNVDDEVEVYGVGKGRNYLVFLTNETHNFPLDEFGNLKAGALENGSTEVRFYKMVNDVLTKFTYDGTAPYGANTYRTGSIDVGDYENITASGSSLGDDFKLTPTSVSSTLGGYEIHLIDNSDSTNTEFDRQFTFSISEDGIKNKDLEIRISDGGNFIKPDLSTTWSPTFLKIDGIKQNITGSVNWTAPFTLYDSATGGSTTTTGNTVYARYAEAAVLFFANGTTNFPITASVTNTENSVVFTDSDSIKILQDGGNAITVDVSNPVEDVISTNGGFVDDYTDTGTDIQVFQGADLLTFTTGTATFGKYTVSTSISPANSIQLGSISGNGTTTFTISDHDDMDQDEDKVTITYTINGKFKDGSGGTFTKTATQKIFKIKDPQNPPAPVLPTSLRVSDSLDSTPFDGSPGTTGTPTISNTHYGLWNGSGTAITTNTDYDNIGYLGLGATLTSDNNFSTDMKVYCKDTLEIGDTIVLYQDTGSYGNYRLAAKTNADGSGDTVLRLTYESANGSLTVQSLDYIGFGRQLVGPGVVYRGEYDSNETYYYTETRRDIVSGSDGEYYLASNPSDSGTSNWDDPTTGTDWSTFGATFDSVATDILFSQDVYANRTVNIGSDAGNPVIALNSDHDNSNENPYISIGAASYQGAGIFLGYDGGTAKASLVNSDGTRYLKWTGNNLEIVGSITVTGGNAATQTDAANAVTSGSNAASDAQTNAQNFATTAADNAATSASNAQQSADNANTTISNNQAQWSAGEANPTTYTFGPTGGQGFDLADIAPGSTAGLYLGQSQFGYHDGSDWNAYLSSSGAFYLGGESGALVWNGTNLNIFGGGTFTGTLTAGDIYIPDASNPNFSVSSTGIVSASDANIVGDITATGGKIGEWVIDPNNGELRDSDSEIVFDPNTPKISLFTGSSEKVVISPLGELQSVSSTTTNITWSSQAAASPGSSFTGATYTESNGDFKTAAATGSYSTTTFTVPSAGTVECILNIPSISAGEPNSVGTNTQYPFNYQGSTDGQEHGISNTYPQYRISRAYYSAALYLKAFDNSTNEVVASAYLGQVSGQGSITGDNYYEWNASFSQWTGGTRDAVDASTYDISAQSSITKTFTFNTPGTYKFAYVYQFSLRGGDNLDFGSSNGNSTVSSITSVTIGSLLNGGVTPSFDTSVSFSLANNFIELSGGGLQVVTDENKYVQIPRLSAGNTTTPAISIVGGDLQIGGPSSSNKADILPQYNWSDSSDRYSKLGSSSKKFHSIYAQYVDADETSNNRPKLAGLIARGSYSFSQTSTDQYFTVTFPHALESNSYHVLYAYRHNKASSSTWNNLNDRMVSIGVKSTTNFTFSMRQVSSNHSTTVYLDWVLVPLFYNQDYM